MAGFFLLWDWNHFMSRPLLCPLSVHNALSTRPPVSKGDRLCPGFACMWPHCSEYSSSRSAHGWLLLLWTGAQGCSGAQGQSVGSAPTSCWPLSVAAPFGRVTVMLITIQPIGLLWGFGESVQRKHFNQRLALKKYIKTILINSTSKISQKSYPTKEGRNKGFRILWFYLYEMRRVNGSFLEEMKTDHWQSGIRTLQIKRTH